MKKQINKKGFTLVELLAVIVILAIVVLIAMTAVVPRLERARKNVFITEVNKFTQAAYNYYSTMLMDGYADGWNLSGGKVSIAELVSKGHINKSDIENYSGCVSIEVTNGNSVNYKVSISNGFYKYTGSVSDINEDAIAADSTAASCNDIIESDGENQGESDEGSNIVTNEATLLERFNLIGTDIYSKYSNKIIEIKFVNHMNHGSTTIDCDDNTDLKWCVAKKESDKNITSDAIVAWLEESSLDNSKYTLYIGSDKQIYAPTKSYYLFYRFETVKSISFDNFDTSRVTDMSYMFEDCKNLTTLDLSNFNTSNVTNMTGMFKGNNALTNLNLSNFNTSKVTNMSYMFNGCYKLSSLDLSDFNTSRVTDMSYMFSACTKLSSLDLSDFDTSKVTNMSYMFSENNLKSLDLSGFNTAKVTNMSYMFSGDWELKTLDISNFDISKVTNMSKMFNECYVLDTIYLNSIDAINKMEDIKPTGAKFDTR